MSAANEWDVELNTRREIPYLQATMYFFVYHRNTRALYCAEKPTSFMNDNKWIDNTRLTIVRWKTALNHDYKNNNSRNFQFTKFSFIDFVFTDRRSLSGNDQNRPMANLSFVEFHSQPKEMLTPKPLNTQLSVFILVYWFSSPSRKVWNSLSVSNTDILVF